MTKTKGEKHVRPPERQTRICHRGRSRHRPRLSVRDSAAVAAIAKRVGGVDILLNAAGFVHHGTVLECSDEDWDFSFDLNCKSMHRTIRSFLPLMLERGHGSVVDM